MKLVCLLKSILPSQFLAQNRNVLCISSYMSSLAFVYLGGEPHKQLDWSDKYPQQFFIMSGERWGFNVTPSSGKMVTFTLSYAVAFFFPNHLVYYSEWYLWKLLNLSHAFMVILWYMSPAQAITATKWNNRIFIHADLTNLYLHFTLIFRDTFLLVQNTEKCM